MKHVRTVAWKAITIALVGFSALIVLPFLTGLVNTDPCLLYNNTDGFGSTLLATVLFSLATSFLLLAAGFAGALLLIRVPQFSPLGKNLALLLFPVALGNISIAFVTKVLIGDSDFFASVVAKGTLYKLGFVAAMQFWQFGLLFIYLLWMQLHSISAGRLEYASANRFSFFQLLKDVYLPATKNLCVLIACVGYVNTFFEESKMSYLFKASPGTNSELVTTWMVRTYQSKLLLGPGPSRQLIFNAGGIVTIVAAALLVVLFFGVNTVFTVGSRAKFYPAGSRSGRQPRRMPARIGALLLIAVVVLPVVFCVVRISGSINSAPGALVFPFGMSMFAAVLSAAVAIVFGISARLGWKRQLQSFNGQSVYFFVALFLLLLVPPIVLLLCGYRWMAIVGYASTGTIYTVWFVGHVLLALPMLGSFVLLNHFRVSNNEIDYNRVYRLTAMETVRVSFLSRFKGEYLLLLVLGFSFIWNEGIFNTLFSDYIPSFVSDLTMQITGRGANYSIAYSYLLVSILIALTIVALWRLVIARLSRNSLQ